jgi:hypothetical protein
MESRDNFKWVLAPWDRLGVDLDTRPDAIVDAKIDGQLQPVLLKRRGIFGYFRTPKEAKSAYCACRPRVSTTSLAPPNWNRCFKARGKTAIMDGCLCFNRGATDALSRSTYFPTAP